MAKEQYQHNVVQHGDRDWAAIIQERTGSVQHERVEKSKLDDDVQVDAVRFFKWSPELVAVQIRERTDGKCVYLSTAKMPIDQFLYLCLKFCDQLRQSMS